MVLDKLNARDALGFLSWKVARMSTNDLAARFAEAGVPVTVEQWRVLIPLAKMESGLTQGQVCLILSQEKTGVSRLVTALEKRGLLHRESCPTDRRVKHLHITDAGRRLVESTVEMAIQSRDTLVEGVDPKELEVCKRVLWQIIGRELAPDICSDKGC